MAFIVLRPPLSAMPRQSVTLIKEINSMPNTNTLSPLRAPQSQGEIFTNTEAAEYIGVSPKTLEVWRCTKRYNIPFIKVGRLVKYRKSALDAFMEARTVDTAA